MDIEGFREYMIEEELSSNTIDVYIFSVRKFFEKYSECTKANVIKWKAELESEFSPKTVNLRITAIERYCQYKEMFLKIKRLKVMKECSVENIITVEEYNRLMSGLEKDDDKKSEIYIKLLSKTGARISEALKFTKKDLEKGSCLIKTKTKYRSIKFPSSLIAEAKEFYKDLKPDDKLITITTRGYDEFLKRLSEKYGIPKEKMHAHSFRHYFAIEFLKRNNNISLLADLLGHSNVNTTQIYLRMSQEQQINALDKAVDW